MSYDPTAAAKAALRRQVRERLRQMSPENRASASRHLCDALLQQSFWRSARRLLCFAPLPGEVDIWPLVLSSLKQGKCIFLPRFDAASRSYTIHSITAEADVIPGYYGIREPAGHCPAPLSNLLDLILVPGVAFDSRGRRLGRGKGYYDRLLRAWCGKTCGVCFDEQIVERVPVETHDIQLDCILTPTRFFQPGGSE